MSMNQLHTELLKVIALGKSNQNSVIRRLEKLYEEFGSLNMQKWRNTSNKSNSLLHESVDREMPEVIQHLVEVRKFDIDVRRGSDGLTPLQLASENQNSEITALLVQLGAGDIQTEDVSTWLSDDDKKKALNIVWVDLEMTSLEDPDIIECAVIITDKDLHVLDEKNWVIHFERSYLDTLGDWHQKTFADIDKEGNGLFADSVKSKLTNQQVEDELLHLIKRHCPPKVCSLAGSSIHIDKQVLKKCMPKVHDYLHYRIIDVTSFQLVLKRWAPEMEFKIKRELATAGQEIVNHRAMDDIKWSISFMKRLRKVLKKLGEPDQPHRQSSPNPHYRGSNHQHRGASNHQPRGASNNYPRGASNNYPRGASNHGAKGSIIRSESDDDSDLPNVLPSIDPKDLYTDERRLVERIELERGYDVGRLRLTEKWQRVYNDNPHLREVFMNKRFIVKYEKDFTKDNRVLSSATAQSGNNNANAITKKYFTTEHWGQRKLVLTEIEFLTHYGLDDDYTVIYAGAAPGSHLNYLGGLFPQLEFIFIDDREFSIKEEGKVQIRAEKFTDDLAKRYSTSSRKILFICNVRTFRAQADGQNDGKEDMDNQLNWVTVMKPAVSLLNFRLPNQPGRTRYPKGHQIIEPWASKRLNECRLVVKKDAKLIDYDHQDFEQNLIHFQNVTRVMYYKHNMDEVDNEGLDHCYDCRAEIFILQEYLSKVQKVKSESILKAGTAAMSREISERVEDKNRPKFIDAPRTLAVIPKKSTVVSTNV